jgi:two-component system alkaline phosphatase synthesis response regulator PhoP
MRKTIFVVEDDENIREMVKIALRSFDYDAVVFDNAEDCLRKVKTEMPDMLIFDIMLPGLSGLAATKKVRENPKTKDLPIILLTAKDTELDKVTGLDSGADDYITKPFGIMEFGARIRAAFRRGHRKGASGAEDIFISDLRINHNTREVWQNGKAIDLTFKEYELLRLLAHEQDRIVPREEILNTVWGFDFVGESRTLDIHIRTLRQKLGDGADEAKYIKTVRNVGYRFVGK